MDKKIERQKERAEKESEPRALTPDDQRRLDEILVGLLIKMACNCGTRHAAEQTLHTSCKDALVSQDSEAH